MNVTILGSRPGGRNRVIQEGPRLTPKEIRRFEIRYRQWLRRSRLVVLSGRNAVGAPADWYARLVRLARKEGVPAAVDTSGTALEAALKAKPFLIKPNRAEAEAILHRRLDSPAQIKKTLRYFYGRGVRVVLLSLARAAPSPLTERIFGTPGAFGRPWRTSPKAGEPRRWRARRACAPLTMSAAGTPCWLDFFRPSTKNLWQRRCAGVLPAARSTR